MLDGKTWIGCDTCNHWNHDECIKQVGQIQSDPWRNSLREKMLEMNEDLYLCLVCEEQAQFEMEEENISFKEFYHRR